MYNMYYLSWALLSQCYNMFYITDLKDTFGIFDKNDDGLINYMEVRDMLISLGKDASEWRVRQIIEDIDTDGSTFTLWSSEHWNLS